MASAIAVPSLVMRVASHAGTRPPCRGRSATPDRFILLLYSSSGWSHQPHEIKARSPATAKGATEAQDPNAVQVVSPSRAGVTVHLPFVSTPGRRLHWHL